MPIFKKTRTMRNTKHIFLLTIIMFASLLTMAQSNAFTKKYSGTYHMLGPGSKVTATTDKYVLKPDGKATWTFFADDGKGKMAPVTKTGTWTAEDGVIHLFFNNGEGEGSELISDFRFEQGVFRGSEGLILKKAVQNTKAK